jgi:hypothetical protein
MPAVGLSGRKHIEDVNWHPGSQSWNELFPSNLPLVDFSFAALEL